MQRIKAIKDEDISTKKSASSKAFVLNYDTWIFTNNQETFYAPSKER